MGISWPWDDECDPGIVIDNVGFTLIKGPVPNNNVLFGLYADWDCIYQANDGSGRVVTITSRRVLWVIDF